MRAAATWFLALLIVASSFSVVVAIRRSLASQNLTVVQSIDGAVASAIVRHAQVIARLDGMEAEVDHIRRTQAAIRSRLVDLERRSPAQ